MTEQASTNKTIRFDLVSPERVLVSEDVQMVVIPGEEGDFGVLADHAPTLSSLRSGVVHVHLPSGEVKRIFVAGGFADVNGELCSVLAEEAVAVDELDKATLEQHIANLNDEIALTKDDAVKQALLQAQVAVAQAKILAVA